MENKLEELFNFNADEDACKSLFCKKLADECNLMSRLLSHKEDLITQLNHKIKDTQFPDWTIEIFLSYNLTLLYSSYNNLSRGYLGVSQAILRPVVECTALSMYFFEFPKDEETYRQDRAAFYLKLKSLGYSNWIEGVLERVDKEGTKFAKTDVEKGQSWKKFLLTNIGEEASNFLHANPDYIFPVIYGGEGEGFSNYLIGPNWVSDTLMKNALWKIIEATLINTVVFDRIFKEHLEVNNFKLISETVERLNSWKKEYNSTSPFI